MLASKEEATTVPAPSKKIFLRPHMSANRPNTRTNMELAIRKAVGTQLSSKAVNLMSAATTGRAALTEESITGTENAFGRTMKSSSRCSTVRVDLLTRGYRQGQQWPGRALRSCKSIKVVYICQEAALRRSAIISSACCIILSIRPFTVGRSLIKPATIPQDQTPTSTCPSCMTFG